MKNKAGFSKGIVAAGMVAGMNIIGGEKIGEVKPPEKDAMSLVSPEQSVARTPREAFGEEIHAEWSSVGIERAHEVFQMILSETDEARVGRLAGQLNTFEDFLRTGSIKRHQQVRFFEEDAALIEAAINRCMNNGKMNSELAGTIEGLFQKVFTKVGDDNIFVWHLNRTDGRVNGEFANSIFTPVDSSTGQLLDEKHGGVPEKL